jgi:hypothetical protein
MRRGQGGIVALLPHIIYLTKRGSIGIWKSADCEIEAINELHKEENYESQNAIWDDAHKRESG